MTTSTKNKIGLITRLKSRAIRLYDKIISDDAYILLSVLALLAALVVAPTALSHLYGSREFLKDIWANVNAMVIDLLVVGLVVKVLSNIGSRRRTIQQYRNEIDDLRGWPDQVAAHKIRGNIMRLNKLGISKMDLKQCYLARTDLAGVNLIDSDLWKATFEECDLENSNLEKSDFWSGNLKAAILRNANLRDAKLVSCELTKADLSGANLTNASLRDSVLSDVELTDSILDYADFSGVKDLGPVRLSKAKSAIGITIDEKLMTVVKRLKPDLFGDQSAKSTKQLPL